MKVLQDPIFVTLIVCTIISIALLIVIIFKAKKSQLKFVFSLSLVAEIICSVGLIAQATLAGPLNINPICFEYVVYIGTCTLPVGLLFTGIIFAHTKIKFRKSYLLLLVVPMISLIVLWTNNYHHLFYESYSPNLTETVFGPYFMFHTLYSYTCMAIGLVYLIRFSIKNSSSLSKQSILIIVGTLIPFVTNILATFKIIDTSIYLTPVTFTITIVLLAIAMFKFQFLSVAPIALQKVVDRMSDAYLVIADDGQIVDYNKTFINSIGAKNEATFRKSNVYYLFEHSGFDFTKEDLDGIFSRIASEFDTVSFEKYSSRFEKYYRIEFSAIISGNNYLGALILFKDITQHILDMQTIKNSQDILIERERLATLGQMIGGIAHNLKTPIMSISGAREALQDLVKEYDASIGDADVTNEDHHEIANDMQEWLDKIKTHLAYMSDIITAVKGQAVTMSATAPSDFTVGEVLNQVNILMKHELKNALITLKIDCKVSSDTQLNGNITSLVQVINNIMSNAIQSYNGEPNNSIDLMVYPQGTNLIIAVRDYGSGMSKSVQDKLFNSMITTKGKKGTGLGLFMSYSNIKAHFNGDITFESEEGKGTTFFIKLPLNNVD